MILHIWWRMWPWCHITVAHNQTYDRCLHIMEFGLKLKQDFVPFMWKTKWRTYKVGFFWARRPWIEIEVKFSFLLKKNIFLVLLRVKNPKMGFPLNIFEPKKYFDPLKVGFFGPGGQELKLRSDFRCFTFFKIFIILSFF